MMELERLAAVLGAAEVVGREPVEVRDLVFDARDATPGAAFFAVPGARVDGHDYAAQAVSNGAVALVEHLRHLRRHGGLADSHGPGDDDDRNHGARAYSRVRSFLL